jgi:hypothetical protein
MNHDEAVLESRDHAVGDEREIGIGLDDRDGIVDGQRLVGYFADGDQVVIRLDAANDADDGLRICRFESIARLIERNHRRRGGRWRRRGLFRVFRAADHQTSRDNCSRQANR